MLMHHEIDPVVVNHPSGDYTYCKKCGQPENQHAKKE